MSHQRSILGNKMTRGASLLDPLLDRSDEGTGEGSEHEERRPSQLPEACMHEQGSSGSD